MQALAQDSNGHGAQSAYHSYLSNFEDLLVGTTSSLATWHSAKPDDGSQLQPYGVLVAGLQQALKNLLARQSLTQGYTTALTKVFEMKTLPQLGHACLSATCKILEQNQLPSPAYPAIMAAVIMILDQQPDTEQIRVLCKLLSSTVRSCQDIDFPAIFNLLQVLHKAHAKTDAAIFGSLCFILQVHLLQGSCFDVPTQQLLTLDLVQAWVSAAFRFCNQPDRSLPSELLCMLEDADETLQHFSIVINDAVARTHCLVDLCTQLARLRVSPMMALLNMQLGPSAVNEEIFAALLQVHGSSLELDATAMQYLLRLFQQSSHAVLLLEIAGLLLRALQDPRGLAKGAIAEVRLHSIHALLPLPCCVILPRHAWGLFRPRSIIAKQPQYSWGSSSHLV